MMYIITVVSFSIYSSGSVQHFTHFFCYKIFLVRVSYQLFLMDLAGLSEIKQEPLSPHQAVSLSSGIGSDLELVEDTDQVSNNWTAELVFKITACIEFEFE